MTMPMTTTTMTVERRYRGPSFSANGGYVCGRVARLATVPVEVALRQPAPLDEPLDVEARGDGGVTIRRHGALVAEAAPADLDLDVPAPVSLAQAEAASARYLGFERFPGASHNVAASCFVCGPERAEGDGMRLFPGPVEGRPLVAAVWRPDGEGPVAEELVWAALDCPGVWAFGAFDPPPAPPVLGRLAVRRLGEVIAGRPYSVAGWVVGRERRKLFAATALFDASGGTVAVGRATWVVLGM
jgi:hypothetical protein